MGEETGYIVKLWCEKCHKAPKSLCFEGKVVYISDPISEHYSPMDVEICLNITDARSFDVKNEAMMYAGHMAEMHPFWQAKVEEDPRE